MATTDFEVKNHVIPFTSSRGNFQGCMERATPLMTPRWQILPQTQHCPPIAGQPAIIPSEAGTRCVLMRTDRVSAPFARDSCRVPR